MREPICKFCGEYDQCICRFETCSVCKASYSNWDTEEGHGIYEYRGALSCEKCHDQMVTNRDAERQEVMEIVNASVKSQRDGEFINNRDKYNAGNVAPDGLPIIKVTEPEAVKRYEGRLSDINKE